MTFTLYIYGISIKSLFKIMSDLEEEDTLFLQIAVFLRLNKKIESKNK